ncbi:MAG: stage III sporulation protein AB [Ruminococcus sp.]|nr:stage III sporulation protein AB [Ruminococcus sp.]
MLRLSGCLFMITASSLFGFELSSRLRRRAALLRNAVSMLKTSGDRMRFTRPVKDKLIASLKADPQYRDLFDKRALQLLGEEAVAVLERFFDSLGTTDITGQEAMTAMCISELSRLYSKAEDETKSKCRLFEILGFMTGAFISVMMI